ncbi:hypothetical protein AC579_10594 [Pseudocercospora musae]|uniref:DUF6604 domain-containing protein n=1 Tax=Pseudocercospora musae TaxID=113226 RepID=A0A139ILB0_9PEZI|nr:hypothetical protein AC579_10594 [Pseudocercospora musae]
MQKRDLKLDPLSSTTSRYKMLTEQLSSRYCLYKQGTNRLVRWITKTASSCRRSLVKSKDGVVSTKNLLECTEAIVSWKPSIDIPAHMLELLEDVILGRSLCARFYTSQGKKSHEEAEVDRSHSHFISVLEDVMALLKGARAKRAKKLKKARIASSNPDTTDVTHGEEKLSNLFENLLLEEPSEADMQYATSKTANKKHSASPAATVEVDEAAEKRFAIWCFLQDAKEIRGFSRQTWREWRSGQVAFETAATISELAMQMIRLAGLGLVDECPEAADYEDMLAFLGVHKASNVNDQVSLAIAAEKEDKTACFGEELLFPLAAAWLLPLWSHWKSVTHQIWERQNGEGGKVDAQSFSYTHPEDSKGQFEFHPFARLMWKCFPDLYRMVRSQRWDLEMDAAATSPELLACFITMEREDRIPVWTVCIAQICMDTHEEIGENAAETGLNILVDRTSTFESVLAECEKMQNSKGVYKDEVLDKLVEKAKGWRKLALACSSRKQYEEENSLLPGPDCISYHAYRALHAQLGSKLYNILTAIHDAGIIIGNRGLVLLGTAHLYKAAQHVGLVQKAWQDMDWFLETHSKHRAFVQEVGNYGDIYGDMKAFARHFELALGSSLESLRPMMPNARAARTMPNFGRARKRRFDTPSELRLAGDEVLKSEKVLGVKREVLPIILQKMAEKRDRQNLSHGASRWYSAQKPNYTGLQLLETYKQLRLAEELPLDFDYISFWMSCVRLLEQIRAAIARMVDQQSIAFDYMLVHFVFVDFAEANVNRKPADSTALGAAAKVLGDYIEKDGGVLVAEAKRRARGYVPLERGLALDDTAKEEEQAGSLQ